VAALLVETSEQNLGADDHSATASWLCRDCGDLVTLPVDRTALRALAGAGATVINVAT
jgi:hypothetical protein